MSDCTAHHWPPGVRGEGGASDGQCRLTGLTGTVRRERRGKHREGSWDGCRLVADDDGRERMKMGHHFEAGGGKDLERNCEEPHWHTAAAFAVGQR